MGYKVLGIEFRVQGIVWVSVLLHVLSVGFYKFDGNDPKASKQGKQERNHL